jgi:predicted ATP-dependent endonuclease of OLD family
MMRIIRLTAENLQRLKAVDITPQGNTVVLSGKNAQGKTSVLDAIWLALQGGTAGRNRPKPIREGAQGAVIQVDLGDITVMRKWTANDRTYLEVTNKDGAVYKSPQKILDKLVGSLAFDPLEFVRSKNQETTLAQLIDVDIDEYAERRQVVFDERRDVNRAVKNQAALMGTLAAPADDLPAEEVSVAEISSKYREALQLEAENKACRTSLTITQAEVGNAASMVDHAMRELERAQDSLKYARNRLSQQKQLEANTQAQVDALKAPDIEALQAQLQDAEGTNRQIREAKDYREAETKLARLRDESADLTAKIKAVDDERAAAIGAASFPVDGLGFDEDGVTYQGIPFAQASSAEKLRVSMAVAMALNPELRVIRITDGSLLDSENMAMIEEMAEAEDFQVWVEVVDDSGKVGIYIEDGEVVEAKQEAT